MTEPDGAPAGENAPSNRDGLGRAGERRRLGWPEHTPYDATLVSRERGAGLPEEGQASCTNIEVDPIMVGYTPLPEQYARDSEARAEKYLAVARVEAGIAGVPCETVHATQDHVYEAIIDTGQQERLRSDLHGLARAQGDLGARARQRDLQSTQSQQDPGPGPPVSSPRSSGLHLTSRIPSQ